MSWLCCAHKPRHGKREDVYRMADEENSPTPERLPVNGRAEPPQPQFSWDKRERIDLSKVTISGLHEETILRTDFAGEPAIIEKCKESIVIILGFTAAVTIDDCSECLIVVGPCSGSVFVRDCFSCCVLTVCQQLRTRDCHGLELALRSMSQPIIEQSSDVVVRPLSLFYENLKNHMQKAGLDVFRNEATSVHDFTPDKLKSNFQLHNDLLHLSENGVNVLNSNGVEIDASTSLFPVNCSGESSISFAYKGANENSEEYQEDRQKLTAELNVSPKVAVMCSVDLEICQGERLYSDLPFSHFGRVSIVACSGKREEFERLINFHGGYVIVEATKSAEFHATMVATGILPE